MKVVLSILLSVTLLQYVVAKPSPGACETFYGDNLKFVQQENGDFEWNKNIVNLHQNIGTCLRTSDQDVGEINIHIIDLNNGDVVAKGVFSTRQGQEVCRQLLITTMSNDLMIKLTKNGGSSKLDYFNICQANIQPVHASKLDTTKPVAVNGTTTTITIPEATWTPPVFPPSNTTSTTTQIPEATWTPPVFPPSTTTSTTTQLPEDTWTPPVLPPSTTTSTNIPEDTWTPPALPPSTTTSTTTQIPEDIWTPPDFPPSTTSTTTETTTPPTIPWPPPSTFTKFP